MDDNVKKGLGFSLAAHAVLLFLLGCAALYLPERAPKNAIYDVALVTGFPAASPGVAALPHEQGSKAGPELSDIKENFPAEKPRAVPESAPDKKVSKEAAGPAEGTVSQNAGSVSGSESRAAGSAAAGSGGASGTGEEGSGNEIASPAVPPKVTASRAPAYPQSAREKGIEGTAVVRFLVGKDGSVEDAVLSRSSGSKDLDRAALKAARGFRFAPGLDGAGRPVRCYAYQPFGFRIEK